MEPGTTDALGASRAVQIGYGRKQRRKKMDTFEELKISKMEADLEMGAVSRWFHQLKRRCEFRSEENHEGDDWYRCANPQHSFNMYNKITPCSLDACPRLK